VKGKLTYGNLSDHVPMFSASREIPYLSGRPLIQRKYARNEARICSELSDFNRLQTG
jgi:hypothetical protein